MFATVGFTGANPNYDINIDNNMERTKTMRASLTLVTACACMHACFYCNVHVSVVLTACLYLYLIRHTSNTFSGGTRMCTRDQAAQTRLLFDRLTAMHQRMMSFHHGEHKAEIAMLEC